MSIWKIYTEGNNQNLIENLSKDWQEGTNICLVNPALLKLKNFNIIKLINFAISRIDFNHEQSVLLCTSGTTGDIKFVLIEEKAIKFNLNTINSHLKIKSNTTILGTVPLFHAFGLNLCFLHALEYQYSYQCIQRGDLIHLFECLNKYQNQRKEIFLPLVPQIIEKFPEDIIYPDLRGVTITGGDIVYQEHINKLNRIFPHLKHTIGYGMTEAGPIIAHTKRDEQISKSFSLGHVFKEIDYSIKNKELYFKSPGQCSFIFQNNQWRRTKEKWLNTGDYVEELDDGLVFKGRTKNRIKINSEFIYPEKIIAEIKSQIDFLCQISLNYNHSTLKLVCFSSLSSDEKIKLTETIKTLPTLYRPKGIEYREDQSTNSLGKLPALLSA